MKPGKKIKLTLRDLVGAMMGRLIYVTFPGADRQVQARITELNDDGTATVTVVPDNTKE